jgi:hypothetical protein
MWILWISYGFASWRWLIQYIGVCTSCRSALQARLLFNAGFRWSLTAWPGPASRPLRGFSFSMPPATLIHQCDARAARYFSLLCQRQGPKRKANRPLIYNEWSVTLCFSRKAGHAQLAHPAKRDSLKQGACFFELQTRFAGLHYDARLRLLAVKQIV